MCLFLIKVYVPLVTNTERTKVAARSIFQHEADGAVVRTEDIGEDGGVFNAVGEAVADDVVVDAPAGILLPRLEAVGPVGVGFDGFRVKVTESVSEPRFKEFRELSSFLVGEACTEMVGGRVSKVNFLVRHVQVAADNHRFLCVKPFDIGTEGVFPSHAIVQASQFLLRVRHIDRDEEEVRHFKRDNTTFVVMFLNAETIGDVQRFLFAEDRRAGITFLFSRVPIRMPAGELHVQLTGLHFGFLQTEEVGVKPSENFAETFLVTGAQPIDVPRDEFCHK